MFKFLQRKQPNAIAVTELLVKAMGIKVSRTTIEKSLQDHPEFPSLLALSDCLSEWHLPNQAYNIAKTDYDPTDLEYPFIAHSKANGGIFMLVHDIVGKQVIYSDEHHYKASYTEEEFLKRWSGIALHATSNSKSGEADYQTKNAAAFIAKLKVPALVITLLLAIVFSLNWQEINLGYSLFLGLKLAGITVSIILLMHSIDANNPFVQNLCSLGNKNNCNAILKSDAAKVTKWLSWSEVGFFYFTGSFLALLFTSNTLSLLLWLNVLAMPYTIYSISYQYRHKNWCVLCCTVQVLLGLEFLNNLTLNNSSYNLEAQPITLAAIIALAISFLLPILVWSFLKPLLLKTAQYQPLKQQLKKFKYNSSLFNQVLTNQACYAVPDDLMPIVLGNPNAETTITMVSNPFCGPCATAHAELDQWLAIRDDIKLKIIFTTADHDDDEKTKVARHATALSLLKDTQLLENALNDWYTQGSKKYEAWAQKYPIMFNGEMKIVTEKQKAWCKLTEIAFTPTILVNGYKLPEPYRLEDIKYLLT